MRIKETKFQHYQECLVRRMRLRMYLFANINKVE